MVPSPTCLKTRIIEKACEFFDRIHEQSVVMACHDFQKSIKIDSMRLYICLSCDCPGRHACKINNPMENSWKHCC